MEPVEEPAIGGAHEVETFVREHRDEILDDWRSQVRQLPSAKRLDPAALFDHLPALLDRVAAIAADLAQGGLGALADDVAERHAVERLDEGFDLGEVVTEYALLRDCMLRRWIAVRPSGETSQGMIILDRAVDHAVAAAVERYTHIAHRTLQSLDRVSLVALESRDLGDLLGKLLEVFVQTTPAADTAVILLREGDLLRVRAFVGLDDAVARGFSIRIGEGFAGTIAAQRQPVLLRAAAVDALVKSEAIRRLKIRCLYGVPLLEAGHVIGVAHIGSRTAYDFSDQDKHLFVALANRATAVISQHLIKEAAERRTVELAAEIDRRRELEAAVSGLHDYVYLFDREGRFTWANATMLEFMGRPAAEVIGKTVAELGMAPDLVERNRKELAEVLQGRTVRGEIAATTPTGLRGEFEYIMTPIFGDDGRVRAIAGLTRNITDRKRAEQQQVFLKHASEVLAGSLHREEIVAALGRLTVPDFADCCVVELVNEAGLPELAALEHVDPGIAAGVRERRAGGEIFPSIERVSRTLEPRLLSELPPGVLPELRLASAIIVPLLAQGCSIGAIALGLTARGRYRQCDLEVAQELAARTALALEHARLYREAQAAIRARESVLAVVSHDLRNPLGAIGMSAAILSRRASTDAMSRKHLHIIQRSVERMVHLIEALLDMASVQAGRLAVTKERHPAQGLVDEVFELNEPLALEKGLSLVRDFALGDAELYCDRERVLQVFSNLIGNALKFTEWGGRITLRAIRREGQIQFAVSDTGPGIPRGDLPQIFDPYWSAKRHERQGRGLGLFITRGIVEAHGGHIWVESRLGQGTTFYFTLPQSSPRQGKDPGAVPPPSSSR